MKKEMTLILMLTLFGCGQIKPDSDWWNLLMQFEQVMNQSLNVAIEAHEGDTQAQKKLALLNQKSKEIVEQIKFIYANLSKPEKQRLEQAIIQMLKRLRKNALEIDSPIGKKAAALYQRTIYKYEKSKSLNAIDQ